MRNECGADKKRALVACSLDCGKNLREIERIQQKHNFVLFASHDRLLPDGEFCDIPENYLLLSEIATRDASRHGNTRLHDVRAVSGAYLGVRRCEETIAVDERHMQRQQPREWPAY